MKINLYLFSLAIILFISCNPFKHKDKNEVEHDEIWRRHNYDWKEGYVENCNIKDCFIFYTDTMINETFDMGKSLYTPQISLPIQDSVFSNYIYKQLDSLIIFAKRFPKLEFVFQVQMFESYESGDDDAIKTTVEKYFYKNKCTNIYISFATADGIFCKYYNCEDIRKNVYENEHCYLGLLMYHSPILDSI